MCKAMAIYFAPNARTTNRVRATFVVAYDDPDRAAVVGEFANQARE